MQYIVNYDIENSKIYTVVSSKHRKEKVDTETRELWTNITRAIAEKLKQSDTRFISDENYDDAEKMIIDINNKCNGDYILIPLTHKYLSNFLIYKVQETPIEKVVVDDDIVQSWFAYTPQDDYDCFCKLIKLWLNGNDVLLCAHNLEYEYRYIMTNVQRFLSDLRDNAIERSIIADKTSDIKSLEYVWGTDIVLTRAGKRKINDPHVFMIRDTCLMSGGRSIKDLGASYGLPKLDYVYNVTRIDKNDLEDHDYDYNRRDNEVALTFLLDLMRQNPDYINIKNMPVSATQHYKNECRRSPTINPIVINYKGKEEELYKRHGRISKNYNMPTEELHRYFFSASGGGIVGTNPLLTGMWFDNCNSYDISSAHPSQVFNRRFPTSKGMRECKQTEYKNIISSCKNYSQMMLKNPKALYNKFNPNSDYLIYVELIGVSERLLPNNNCVNCLGTGVVSADSSDFTTRTKDGSKTGTRRANTESYIKKDLDKDHTYFKNGKVRKVKRYEKWFYRVDLIYILCFYDVEEIIIKRAFEYKMTTCDDYTLNCFKEFAQLKYVYKELKNIAKKKGFQALYDKMIEYHDKGMVQDYTINSLPAHKDDYVEFMENELLRVKAIFNGCFGICYQNPVHIPMDFNDKWEIVPTGDGEDYKRCIAKTTTHYTVGAYIACWSRFELACMMCHCINNGGTLLYWATDSIKCIGTDEHLFDGWYDGLKNVSNYGKYNEWNFGAVDCETVGNKVSIFVIENLKHIDICINMDDEVRKQYGDRIDIHYTLSGFRGAVYLADILKEWCVEKNGSEIVYEGVEYNDENVARLKEILAEKGKPQIILPENSGKQKPDYSNKGMVTPLGQVNFCPIISDCYNLGHYHKDTMSK